MKYSINLARRAYVNKKILFLGYLLCGLVLIAGLLYNVSYYFRLEAQISSTETRLNELKEKILTSQGADVADYSADRYDKVLAEIKLANGILDRDSFRWTVLLDQLETVVPGHVKIQSISPDHDNKSIKILGVAKELKDMKRFLDNLIKSEQYEDVLLIDQALEKDDAGADLKFTIQLLGAF